MKISRFILDHMKITIDFEPYDNQQVHSGPHNIQQYGLGHMKGSRMVLGHMKGHRMVLDPPKNTDGIQPHFKQCLFHRTAATLTFSDVHDCESVSRTCGRKSCVQLSEPKHVSGVSDDLCKFYHRGCRHWVGCCEHAVDVHVQQQLVHPKNTRHTAYSDVAGSVHVFQHAPKDRSVRGSPDHTLDTRVLPYYCLAQT